MFFPIFLLVWTSLNAYVLARLLSVPFLARHVPVPVTVTLVVVVAYSYLAARLTGHYRLGRFPRTLEYLGAQWIGVAFLLLVAFLAADLVSGFGLFLGAYIGQLRTGALLSGVALAVISMLQARRAPAVTSYELALPGLPTAADGAILVAVSDLHLGLMLRLRWASALAAQLSALRPDVLLLVGDIFEAESSTFSSWLPVLERFQAPRGVYMVTGNHELYAGGEKILDLMRRAGFQVLRDASAEPIPGLVVSGVDDPAFRHGRQEHHMVVQIVLDERPAGATVLLSHRPVQFEQAARAGVKLMLSGHTHAGQIWPFQYLTRTAFRLVAGRYDLDGISVIVGRGTGTWGPRMRLWKRSEIVKITLRSERPPAEVVPA